MRPGPLVLAALLVPLACGDSGAGASETTTGDGSSSGATEPAGPTTADPPTTGDASTSAGATATTGAPGSTGDTGDTADIAETSADDTTGAPAICPPTILEPGDHTITLEHGGLTRSALVHVPPDLDPQAPAPLVLNFHGFTMTAAQEAAFSGMNPLADAAGFVVVYPEGFMNSWNAGACCGLAMTSALDDVGFVRALVAELHAQLCLDPRRVYSTGMSNGGFMSHRLACEASDLIAAIAPVSAVNGMDRCAPGRPVPVMMFNGTADVLVAYEGAGQFDSVAETFAAWGDRDGCDGAPIAGRSAGAAASEVYDACDGGAQVVQWTIDGMGHCWPGAELCPYGAASVDISANAEMWAFFEQHALP